MASLKTSSVPSHLDFAPILRPSERSSLSLPCRIRTDGFDFHRAEAGVVVSRSSNEAALFVAVPSQATSDIRLTHVIPLTKRFKHSLNQTPPSPSTSFFQQSARPHITLSIWDDRDKVELRISSALITQVQAFIAELKRWVDVAKTAPASFSTWSWTSFYPVQPPRLSLAEEELVESPSLASASALSPALSTASDQTIQGLYTPMTSLNVDLKDSSSDEDEEYPNPFADGFSRTAFLRKRLFARQSRWSERRQIKIRLATYNVNDKLPPPGTTELTPMVGTGEEDILVFGFQEVDLRSQALLISQGNVRAAEWESAILCGLKDKAGDYIKITMTQYVGVVTIVFAKRSIREHITNIETSERGIGLLGFGGNKAGVCVRMKIHDSTCCFVNSHLAAFATALERRRQDFHVLTKTLTFPRPDADSTPAFDEFLPELRDKLVTLEDSHVMFWVGDLNYRVDMEDDILRAWVNEQRWQAVLEKDQLIADIASGKSFAGFQEHPIDFPPSFKYVHGSSTLDTRRAPAYTDRILYRVPQTALSHSPPTEIRGTSYTSHEIFWSDHRPVSASYELDVRVADAEKRRAAYVEVERELDKLEELYRPALEVEGANLEFGDVSLRRSQVREVILRNRGRVPARFGFKSPALDKPICKGAIWPFPSTGTIKPGSEATLRVTIHVEEGMARDLTTGQTELNDVLVLQVEEGKETFITVQASFVPTIPNLPLPTLPSLSGPIQSLSLSDRKALASEKDPYETESKGSKPVKEVWTLLEYLMAAAPCPNIWTDEVDQEAVLKVLDAVDSGSALRGNMSPSAVAGCLALILAWIPGGLVSKRAGACEKVKSRDDAFAAIEGLHPVHTNVLIGLMSVVRLCAGVETPLASARESPKLDAGDAIDGLTEAKSVTEDDETAKVAGEAARQETSTPVQEAKVEMPPSTVDERTVEVLGPCVFGRHDGNLEGRKQFIRCMLEG